MLPSLGCETSFWQSVWQLAGEPASRNLGLIIVAVIGIGFAIYRSVKLHQQTKTAIRQADTSEAGLNIDRFQKGAAMLSDNQVAVRQAGILLLSELAIQNTQEYCDLVQKIICLFIKAQTEIQLRDSDFTSILDHDFNLEISTDNQFAISELSRIIKSSLNNNVILPIKCDLRHTNLRSANLNSACLANCNLSGSVLDKADLISTDLSHANLIEAKIRETVLLRTLFYDANLFETDFKKTKFHLTENSNILIPIKISTSIVFSDPNGKYKAKGLTHFQLSQAKNVNTEFLGSLTDEVNEKPEITYGRLYSEIDKFANKIINHLNKATNNEQRKQ